MPRLAQTSLVMISLLAVLCGLFHQAPAQEKRPPGTPHTATGIAEIESLLNSLRDLPQESGWRSWYYDMHGNAHDDIQALMIMRFDATERICQELEDVDFGKYPRYVAVLYHVLAFVKDPAAIPWLNEEFACDRASQLNKLWPPRWGTFLRSASHKNVKWIEAPEQWSAFFQQRFEQVTEPGYRLQILYAMQGWLHDPGTLEFFVDLEQSPSIHGEELLIAQLYLHQHGKPIDVAKLKAVIEEMKVTEEGEKMLLQFADEIRHEVFVPWLVAVAGPKSDETHVGSVQWVLEEITFRRDVSGRDEWEAWVSEHGAAGRETWIRQAVQEFIHLLETDSSQARAFLKKAKYLWKDPALLPHIDKLLQYPPIHDHLAGWINLTYRPHWRKQLQSVADQIIEHSESNLSPHLIRLLKGLDFIEDDSNTWAQHVRHDNMRI